MPNSYSIGNGTVEDPKNTNPTAPDGGQAINTNPIPQVAAPSGEVSPGAGVQAQNVGTGFVNLQSLLQANGPTAQHMAQGLVNNAYAQGGAAQKSGDLDAAHKASQTANGLNSFGGLQSQLMGQYGQNAYNGGQAGFDTLLTGAVGQPAFQAAQKAYGGLYQQLANGQPATPYRPQTKATALAPKNRDPDLPTGADSPRRAPTKPRNWTGGRDF